MILSDEEIRTSHTPYPVFRDRQLEANAELRKAGERIRELENELVLAEQLLNWIDAAIDGERVCDFAESFPLVMKVVDLYSRIRELEAKLRELYGYLLQADKDGESNIPQELGNEIEELLR
jgi:hypothetical protein